MVVGQNYNGTDNDIVIIRYNNDGTLDSSFGATGIVTTDLGGNDIAYNLSIDANGDILVTGSSDNNFMLVRYLSSGTIDTGFGTNYY